MPRKAQRPKLSQTLRNSVMREFNYLCAVCGQPKPQIHHIDGNNANNVAESLLPLCPNCHLLDQHDPTSPFDPLKLRLFRQYKDPLILSPQFQPIFRRLQFLLMLDESTFEREDARLRQANLCDFIRQFAMGAFYARSVDELTMPLHHGGLPDEVEELNRTKYFERLQANGPEAVALIVEFLRYQNWDWKPKRSIG